MIELFVDQESRHLPDESGATCWIGPGHSL
jgi:hypothetical protein